MRETLFKIVFNKLKEISNLIDFSIIIIIIILTAIWHRAKQSTNRCTG